MKHLAFVLTLFAGVSPAAAERLPLIAAPEHYELHFIPDLKSERFEGREMIRVRILSPTQKLVLHAAGLDFTAARVVTGAIEQRAVVSIDPKMETVTFYVPVDLKPGLAELHLEYSGRLNRELRGFYISEANGRKYAATQLEATDARRMFAGFDEPAYKATFDVSVVVASHDNAISNGSVEFVRAGPREGTKTIDFTTTAPMSSYLVALAVGDFECVEERAGAIPLRVCATPDKKPLTRFAMDAARASLEYFNRYFAIDYPFRKLDLVAIPDFAAGAMENTGAVFFRETLLLVEPDASFTARKRAALVIAHELAHQWFGNLVTMKWWDDLWLNEGFATWMEAKAIGAWQPGWSVELDERQATQSAMALDSLLSTRPVRMRAETPDEINELFDPIAYEKAAAVLGMVEAFVGESDFRAGVNAYIQQYRYDNATAENFWTVMTRAAGEPVDKIMRSFVESPGVPLVTVDTTCDAGQTVVTLSQERFLSGAPNGAARTPWAIPVCVGTRGDAAADRCELLDTPEEKVRWPGCARWVVANSGAEGYYRTRYTSAALERLAEANATLRPAERLMLIADTWALLRAGKGEVGSFLTLMSSVATDIEEPAVLEAAAARLQFIHEYLASGGTRDAFERWVRSEFAPLLGPATAPTRTADDEAARARAALLGLVGGVGRDPQVIADARDTVEDHLASPEPGVASPTVLNVLVPLAALEGGAALYGKYLARAESGQTLEERYRFLYGLAAFQEPDLLRRTFEYALSNKVRTQDRSSLIAALLGNPVGRDVVWSLMQARWNELQQDLGAFGGTGRIVEALGAFCDRSRLNDIRQFFEIHPVPSAARTLRQTLEDVELCAALVESQAPELQRWLVGDTERRNAPMDGTRARQDVGLRTVSHQAAEIPVPVLMDQVARRAAEDPGLLVSVDAVVVGPLGPRTFTIRDPPFLDPDGDALVVMAAPLIVTAVERVPVRVIGRLHPAKSHDDALQPPVNPPFPGEPPQLPIIVAESVVARDGRQLAQKPDARGKATTLAAAARAERSELVGRVVEAHEVRVLQTQGDGMFWIGAGAGGASVPRLLVVPASPPASAVEAKNRVDVRGVLLPLPQGFANTLRDRAPTRDEPIYLYATMVRVK